MPKNKARKASRKRRIEKSSMYKMGYDLVMMRQGRRLGELQAEADVKYVEAQVVVDKAQSQSMLDSVNAMLAEDKQGAEKAEAAKAEGEKQ